MTNNASASTDNGEALETEHGDDFSVDDAAALYLKRRADARKEPSEKRDEGKEKPTEDDSTDNEPEEKEEEEHADEGGAEDEHESTQEEGDEEEKSEGEDEEAGDEAEPTYAADDHKVRVKVDGKDVEFSVKDLKRLAGQEQALTRKSQEVSDAQKKYETGLTNNVKKLTTLAERAKADYENYAKIDWPLAAKQLSQEDYKALREDAQNALNNYEFVVKELDSTMTEGQAYGQEKLKEAGQACIKALTDKDNPNYIEGWGDKLYDDIRDFAKKQGMPAPTVDNLVDPTAFKIIHKAMLFDAQQAKTKELIGKVKNKTKVVSDRAVRQDNRPAGQPSQTRAAMKKLAESGDLDDAVEAYYARSKR